MTHPNATDRIGVDLGGTKIAGVVLDEQGQTTAELRLATPQGDYPGTLATIVELVRRLESNGSHAISGVGWPVGVGTPGVCLPETGLMSNCNSTCLNGQPLLADLCRHLGERVVLANDADCFALSEWRLRTAMGEAGQANGQTLMGLILGTGVGAGIVVNGQLLTGPNALAGEWGHMPLPYFQSKSAERTSRNKLEWKLTPRTCYCGRINCIETFLSGPGLTAMHQELWQEHITPEQLALQWPDYHSRRSVTTGGAQASEEAAGQRGRATLELYLDMLARSLAQVINVLDPQTIVLGGGLGLMPFLYHELPRRIPNYLFSRAICHTHIVAPQGGPASGVYGAAWLRQPHRASST